MNPGIFYLYEYKNNQKQRNVGFLKLSRHYQSCSVQLQARQVPVTRQDTLKLAAFYMENETAYTKTVAEISCNTHAISARIHFAESRFPDKRTLHTMHGFLLTLPDGSILAATAPGITLDMQHMQDAETLAPIIAEEPENIPAPVIAEETENAPAPVIAPESEAAPAPHAQVEVESLDFCAVPSAVEPEEVTFAEPTPTFATKPEETTSAESTPVFKETELPQERIRKILRSEMSCLPRKYWNLANNSFLLHGYHNYNHLLLVEKDGHYWLGVPGVYDKREARAAELFGFPQFTASYNRELTLSEEEQSDCGTFGYWCRYLK